MNPRSAERDLLRDYAREVVEVQSFGVPWQAGPRGELAGKTFMALQNVLETTETRLGSDRLIPASEILEAIRKGLS